MSFPYLGRRMGALGDIAVCQLIAQLFAYSAAKNTGRSLVRGAYLTREETTIVFWCFTSFFTLCGLVLIKLLVITNGSTRGLILSDYTLLVPVALAFSGRHTAIFLASIRSLDAIALMKCPTHRVVHDAGSTDIEQSRLASDEAFSTLSAELVWHFS